MVVRLADLPVPFVFEGNLAELREERAHMSPGPGAVNHGPCPPKCPDASHDEAAFLVQSEMAENNPVVPGALSLGEDRSPDVVAERSGSDAEIRQHDQR